MTTDEREQITTLGRERGAELAHTVAGKSRALRVLISPELERLRQTRSRAS